LNACDRHGDSVLSKQIELDQNVSLLVFMLESKADLGPNKGGKTALDYALRFGNSSAVAALIEHKADCRTPQVTQFRLACLDWLFYFCVVDSAIVREAP